ncbi:MAG: cyanophycin synthetase [Gloeomargaritaceae cyanobacterium C42_A2020_066]|nr:cyanophycin synthetase [Gloeomargaritaceae cyanobacterium C42_A2020_066]
MRILKVLTLRGPNYWSIRRQKLIVFRLDLEDLDEKFTDQIPGFYEGLTQLLPSLIEHHCSPGRRGGFLQRLLEGTLMGHVVEHVALELQTLAGMPLAFGRSRATGEQGVYNIVFEYMDERAGRYAGRAAVRICRSLVDTGHYPAEELAQDLEELRQLWAEAALGPTTDAIVQEAQARGIPWTQLSVPGVIQLGYGVHQRRILAAQTDHTSILGVELAGDKEGTKRLLRSAAIPVPKGEVIRHFDDLEEAIERVGGFPVVIKPLDGNHGRGITLNITQVAAAEDAYDRAKAESKTGSVIIERYHEGDDFRVLVVAGRVVAVAQRMPAHVVGDGEHTIAQLVDRVNQDPRRGDGHDNILTRIVVDRASEQVLAHQGYTLDSVLLQGEIAYLKTTANLSTGGTAVDRTDDIHPENIWIAQRAARVIGLDIAGIDIITPDIGRPLREMDGVIVEVNAAPGLRMHLKPSAGQSRNVAAAIVDHLFPGGRQGRVPILALTGTNGKTTTTRLTAHLVAQTGRTVGYTTTDGTYIGSFLAEPGDNTGPQSAQLILQDPTVEVAVLESARGGILRSGLAFDHCDVGVVLNVSDDHLGQYDILTLEQMARVKAVVAEAARPGGWAVLNADDPLVAAMAEPVKAQVAFFSMQPDNPVLEAHLAQGGVAAVYRDGVMGIQTGQAWEPLLPAAEVPLTLGGRVSFMIANALAASLAAYLYGVSLEGIRQGLRTFKASASQTPGRMNLEDLGGFHALVDYAHNPAGYEAIGEFVRGWSSGERIGVVGAPGDRRNEDFLRLGRLSAQIFDRVVVKEDDDTRGRPRGETAALIAQGIQAENPNFPHTIILDETAAIQKTLQEAPNGSLVVILPESVKRALRLLEEGRRTSHP